MTVTTANQSSPAPPLRRLLSVSGADRVAFLQGLVSNDLSRLSDGLVYAALLNPQGKYLADFLLVPHSDAILIDVAEVLADDLSRRLALYRLRADVAIGESPLSISCGLGPLPAGAFPDPRHSGLGWRLYSSEAASDDGTDWVALQVALRVPESGVDLLPNESYILEAGFERLGGVDFRKGCYVGQEVTARMKHKTELRKGLVRVEFAGPAPPPGSLVERDGLQIGRIGSVAQGRGLAHLRLDRGVEGLEAGGVAVMVCEE